MGIWLELGVFLLVFVFAIHQFHDLKQEKRKRAAALRDKAEPPQLTSQTEDEKKRAGLRRVFQRRLRVISGSQPKLAACHL